MDSLFTVNFFIHNVKFTFISSTEFLDSMNCFLFSDSGSLRAALLNATYSSLNHSVLVKP